MDPDDLPPRIEFLADADRPGGWLLLIDRIRQSYVDLEDPDYLDFEYMRSLADVLDALPSGPLTALHLGGGALTLPRYLLATRPGSRQIVFEPDAELIELVRARLPLPKRSGVKVRQVDGRTGLAALHDSGADVLVLDAFVGGRVPAALTTEAFIAEVRRVLKPDGVFMANLADGPPLTYTRRVLATVRAQMPELFIVLDPAVMNRRRFGNVVLAASRAALPEADVTRAAAKAMFPLRVRSGSELNRLIGAAEPFTDDDPSRSPAPPEESWRVGT